MKKKILKISLIVIFITLLIFCISYIIKANSSKSEKFLTETPLIKTIEIKSIATGKINPKEKIEIKPNISGIIKEIYVKEGDQVEVGQLIATIKVVPVVATVNSTMQSINSAKIQLSNQKRIFEREKLLFTQGVISKQEYENAETQYKLAKQTLNQAEKEYDIATKGVASGLENLASIQIRSTTKGMILALPIEVGNQVIEANTFNAGTTIATIADINKMIFEGKVDESDAGMMKIGMPMNIVIGALQDEKLQGNLSFIAPQGYDENGAVKYNIKADLKIPNGVLIRAGYSANAEIVLNERKDVLSVREALVQFDEQNKPFVEILQPNGEYKKQDITLGLSDGLYVEVHGININDKIKIWNASEEDNK